MIKAFETRLDELNQRSMEQECTTNTAGLPQDATEGTGVCVGGWINTKDRLPDLHTLILVLVDGKLIYVGKSTSAGRGAKGNAWSVNMGHLIARDRVSHWMPLPGLPEVAA